MRLKKLTRAGVLALALTALVGFGSDRLLVIPVGQFDRVAAHAKKRFVYAIT